MAITVEEYKKILKLLSGDEKLIIKFIEDFPPGKSKLKNDLVNTYVKQSCTTHAIHSEIAKNIIKKELNNALRRSKYHSMGSNIPRLLKQHGPLLDDSLKREVLKFSMKRMKNFYVYSRKELLKIVVPWVEEESDALIILRDHYRQLGSEELDCLLKKVTNGIDHPDLKNMRKSSAVLLKRKLKGLSVDKPEERKIIINAIAQSPKLYEDLGINTEITLRDLKKLPPVRRFNLIQHIYGVSFGFYSSIQHNWFGKITPNTLKMAFKKYGRYTRLPIESIADEDMKNLLFSVSIKKNNEVAKWWERYKQYKKVVKQKTK